MLHHPFVLTEMVRQRQDQMLGEAAGRRRGNQPRRALHRVGGGASRADGSVVSCVRAGAG
jgi:hypothetical protein